MKSHRLDNNLLSLFAVFAGATLATAIKLVFSSSEEEEPEPDATEELLRNPRNAARLMASVNEAKMAQMREAANDPQYLADMREVNDDFAFADAENL